MQLKVGSRGEHAAVQLQINFNFSHEPTARALTCQSASSSSSDSNMRCPVIGWPAMNKTNILNHYYKHNQLCKIYLKYEIYLHLHHSSQTTSLSHILMLQEFLEREMLIFAKYPSSTTKGRFWGHRAYRNWQEVSGHQRQDRIDIWVFFPPCQNIKVLSCSHNYSRIIQINVQFRSF